MKTILYINAVGDISGAERSLLAMLDALDFGRFTPVLAAPEGTLLREAAARGVRVEPISLRPLRRAAAWHALSALRDGWRQVSDLIARVRPDVAHANGTHAMIHLLSAREVPVVWHVRDLAPLGIIGLLLYKHATRVAVISSAVRDRVNAFTSDDEKCILLPPAVDTAHFRPAADKAVPRARLGLPAGVPLLGMVAQFVRWKRHHLFLDALAGLSDRPWHAILAGADLHHNEKYTASLRRRLAALPFAGRVTWLPWQQDTAPLMSSLDLCVLTSDREPFGRVLIESMSCGVPVVAMDEAGPRDIVMPGQTGLLCPPDAAAIAGAITRLLNDNEQYKRMSLAGRARVEERFSIKGQRKALNELYEQVG